ncbi:MAG: hypothetical protein M0001_16385 [Treponema sp.]|nr:hypothetical protein [Treponema sp.]
MKVSSIIRSAIVVSGIALVVALVGCKTAPVVIPQDLDAPMLVLKAQEASDANNNTLALRYYQALIDRFGDDPSNLATGEYEIAFINFKEGHKAKAKELFTALLARYDGPGGAAFPDRYKVLAKIILAEIH